MSRTKLEIDMSQEDKNKVKSVAYGKGFVSLRSFVIAALRAADNNLKKLK